jgi:hypothetical protein
MMNTRNRIGWAVGSILFCQAVAPASAQIDADTQAQVEAMRVHRMLVGQKFGSGEYLKARNELASAISEHSRIKSVTLDSVRTRPDYIELQNRLFVLQRDLDTLHQQLPRPVQAIQSAALQAMDIRMQISKLNQAAIESTPEVGWARFRLTTAYVAYDEQVKLLREELRTSEELAEAIRRLKSARGAIAGT